ncbi:16801_t:CDS:1, partial [Racocetra fulgida]
MVNGFPYQLTKKATQFEQCPTLFNPPPYTTVISDVKLTPKTNSQLEVNGSATTNKDITDVDFFGFAIFDINLNFIFGRLLNICKDTKTKCPTKEFKFDQKYDLTNELPQGYFIGIAIGPNTTNPIKALACGL